MKSDFVEARSFVVLAHPYPLLSTILLSALALIKKKQKKNRGRQCSELFWRTRKKLRCLFTCRSFWFCEIHKGTTLHKTILNYTYKYQMNLERFFSDRPKKLMFVDKSFLAVNQNVLFV